MLYYLLTGDQRARDAVLQLATWVRNMQDGSKTIFRFLSQAETGLATCTAELAFQGPGRGGAYSINACLDAFSLSHDPNWLAAAEHFIRICIHPDDAPEKMDLLNREARWSYVIFLHILGKYLDIKSERGKFDERFQYAKASLMKYTTWMADTEYPYLDHSEELEYPTSAWAAQDSWKACVFLDAAKYSSPDQACLLLDKSRFFFMASQNYLDQFKDKDSARNLAIILRIYSAWQSIQAGKISSIDISPTQIDFTPKIFLAPQKTEALIIIKKIIRSFGIAAIPPIFSYFRWYFGQRRSCHKRQNLSR